MAGGVLLLLLTDWLGPARAFAVLLLLLLLLPLALPAPAPPDAVALAGGVCAPLVAGLTALALVRLIIDPDVDRVSGWWPLLLPPPVVPLPLAEVGALAPLEAGFEPVTIDDATSALTVLPERRNGAGTPAAACAAPDAGVRGFFPQFVQNAPF